MLVLSCSKKASTSGTKKQSAAECERNFFTAELPTVSSWTDLVDTVFPMLSYLGPHLGEKPVVLTRFIRLMAAYLKEKQSASAEASEELEKSFGRVVDICDEVFLPALTVLDQNCAYSEELWTVIGSFPYQTRYMLYGRWKSEHTKKHPALIVKRGLILGRTRYVMK